MYGRWTRPGNTLSDHLVSEKFSLTNTYSFSDDLIEFQRMELIENGFIIREVDENLWNIRIEGNAIRISGERMFALFKNLVIRFKDVIANKTYRCFTFDHVPIMEGIEIIQFTPPSPPNTIINFKLRIYYKKYEMQEDTSASSSGGSDDGPSMVKVLVEDSYEDNSFGIRVNYDNSLSGQLLNEQLSKRKALNEAYWERQRGG